MNMTAVMPPEVKPVDPKHTSDKNTAARKNEKVAEDNDIFSELLLMLSSSGNNIAAPKPDGTKSLSSGLNHTAYLNKVESSKSDPVSFFRHLHVSGEGGEVDCVKKEAEDKNVYVTGQESPVHAAVDREAYKGLFDMNSFSEDLKEQPDQSPEMSLDAMQEVIPGLVPEVADGKNNDVSVPHLNTGRPDVVSQLSNRFVELYHLGGNTARLRLQPEELGNLHLDIAVDNDSINAVVTVENGSVKDLIEADIDKLIDQLREAGLKIDKFTVNIASSSYDGNIAGGWSDGKSGEMFENINYSAAPVYEDTALSHSDERLIYAVPSGGISIFV